ncbi:28S rRNA (cytosine-C(5))-methyltransferase [Wyeomyia smithii]|uniref:28S rRNA (cytosine-C(5))-methyltransferase n=1 Tax=Wyeomyia smithii TaxID=174621 RepID=UPI002467F671|nr:28S rRNA (cytosine-C(5))-methyltransferase [Wyeomyia smithii]
MVENTNENSNSGESHRQRPHKIPVPTNYRSAAKILRLVVEERRNVKTLVLQDKHLRKGKGLAIMDLILVNLKQIDDLIARTELTQKEPKLNPWLARVLIAELMFGRGELNGESLPVQCVRRYQEALKDALSKSDVTPAKQLDFKEPRYVRINTSVLAQPGAIRLLQEEGWVLVEEEFEKYTDFLERVKNLGDSEFIIDFHFKELLVFPHSARNYWGRATEMKQKFVLQNKACLLPTYLLGPPKKSVVLDMCAAPGLKTTHLANLMKNKGRIYAVERNAERYKLLCEYSAEFGVIKTINEDCLLVADEQAPGVEYILIDPSCSGSGMVDRLKLNEEVDKQRLYKLGGLQYKLLCHAMNAFPAAKRIVYSTCSIYPEENEEIVLGALKHNGHFRLADAKALFDKEWLNFGSSDYSGIGERCLYARPEIDLTIGMFVAVFERCAEDEYNEVYLAHEKQKGSYEKLSKMGNADFGRGRGKKRRPNQYDQEAEIEEHSEGVDELPSASKSASAVASSSDPKKKKRNQSMNDENEQEENLVTEKKKRKTKTISEEKNDEETFEEQESTAVLKKKKKSKKDGNEQEENQAKDKKNRKSKTVAEGENDEQTFEEQESTTVLKKKKKSKSNENEQEENQALNKKKRKSKTVAEEKNDEESLKEQEFSNVTSKQDTAEDSNAVLENVGADEHKKKKKKKKQIEENYETTVNGDAKPLEAFDNDVGTHAKKKKKKDKKVDVD